MTPTQTAHLQQIEMDFVTALHAKYYRGQEEHGGNLWERDVLGELGDELVDAITYYHCVRDNFAKIQAHVIHARQLLSKGDYVQLEDVLDAIYHACK